MSSAVLEQAGTAAARYPRSKGGLRFPVDKPLPVGLVRRLLKPRLAEISAVENGRRIEYFVDGRVKATGQKVGTWKIRNQDGSVARTTRF